MEKNKSEAILFLNYIFEDIKPFYSKIIIEKKEYKLEEVNKKNILIKFNDIETELGSKIINITFSFSEEKKEPFYCEIIPGMNKGILFPYLGSIHDIIFPENQTYKIEIIQDEIKKELDIKDNRLLLINFYAICDLKINGKIFTKEIINNSIKISEQICIVDLDKRLVFRREIAPINYNEFFKMFDEYNYEAKKFISNIDNMMKTNFFSSELYKSYFKQKNLVDILFIKFNLPKNILKNKYNKKEYFDFVASCCLFYILSSFNEEKEIKDIYRYFIKFKLELEKDSELEIYKKNMIMIEFSYLLVQKKSLDKFKKIRFTYYNINKIENDSPLNISIDFLINFIENLDEKSPFIYPLILIDSGNFKYNSENAYGFGLINKEILKSHLKDIIPDIIIVISDKETIHEKAVINKVLGSTILNLASYLLSSLQIFELDKKLENLDINNNIALILFIELFHELFGHKKGGYSQKQEKLLLSPNVFYDKQKKRIMKLVDRNSHYASSNEIKILRDDDKDAGYLLEYFIGECEYGFYCELIEEMLIREINLKFLLDNILWNEDIEIMRNYIKLKYIIFKYDKNCLNKVKYNDINEEIEDLKKIIKEKDIKLDIIQQNQNEIKEAKPLARKRTDLNSFDYLRDKEIEKYEKFSYDEIKQKMDNDETPPELRRILFNILLKRIKRK